MRQWWTMVWCVVCVYVLVLAHGSQALTDRSAVVTFKCIAKQEHTTKRI